MTKETRDPAKIERRTVRVRPHRYQPSKADMEADISIDATPEEVAAAILRPVRVVEDENA